MVLNQPQSRTGIKYVKVGRGDFNTKDLADGGSYVRRNGNIDLVAFVFQADQACLPVELVPLDGPAKGAGILVYAK